MQTHLNNECDPVIAQMRADARDIFFAGIEAVNPKKAIEQSCCLKNEQLWIGRDDFQLSGVRGILVVGAGKATGVMAQAMENILNDRISDGIISVKYDHAVPLKYIQTIEAAHPLPDDNGVRASEKIMALVGRATRNDLVLCLISGGGSALLPLPAENITLKDKQEVTHLLLGCGAGIHEINAVRKHLSGVKGGKLARAAAPARVISLILSDVVGDDLDVIASGPCVPDKSTFGECMQIIQKYDLAQQLPEKVLNYLEAGVKGRIEETPKPGAVFFEKTVNLIVGSNQNALDACQKSAEKIGYTAQILSASIDGDTHTSSRMHTDIAKKILETGQPISPPACILSGGETTLKLKGEGLGGRNQEAALVSAMHIAHHAHIVILHAGTDGTDGPTDAAGAFADNTTLDRAADAGLDLQATLADNNAYPFFNALNDLLITGPTGTNVMDLNIVLVK